VLVASLLCGQLPLRRRWSNAVVRWTSLLMGSGAEIGLLAAGALILPTMAWATDCRCSASGGSLTA
jgi:hypothetical protein